MHQTRAQALANGLAWFSLGLATGIGLMLAKNRRRRAALAAGPTARSRSAEEPSTTTVDEVAIPSPS
jgi:hypothetical protein